MAFQYYNVKQWRLRIYYAYEYRVHAFSLPVQVWWITETLRSKRERERGKTRVLRSRHIQQTSLISVSLCLARALAFFAKYIASSTICPPTPNLNTSIQYIRSLSLQDSSNLRDPIVFMSPPGLRITHQRENRKYEFNKVYMCLMNTDKFKIPKSYLTRKCLKKQWRNFKARNPLANLGRVSVRNKIWLTQELANYETSRNITFYSLKLLRNQRKKIQPDLNQNDHTNWKRAKK